MPSSKSGRTPLKLGTILLSTVLSGTAVLGSGCGVLGNKVPEKSATNVGGSGCLNESKDLVNRYMSGEISQSEWKSSFDCINESLGFFTDYVRGSAADAYTQGDMYNLVKNFLLTNARVNPDLMQGAFALKTALFGGVDSKFTREEVELLKKSLTRLEAITSDLIPYLAVRKKPNPSHTEILELVAAFKRAGDQLADFVETLPASGLSNQALETLINQLAVTLEIDNLEGASEDVFLGKWILFNSRRDAIMDQDWPKVFRTAMGAGGIFIAYKIAMENNNSLNLNLFADRIFQDYRFRDLMWDLALEFKPYLENAITAHGGAVPMPLLDHLVDALPPSVFEGVPARVRKNSLRALIRRGFFSNTQIGFDSGVLNTVYDLLGNIVKDLGLLDRMYDSLGLNKECLTSNAMSSALAQYLNTIQSPSDAARFRTIRDNIMTYAPLFRKRSGPNGDVYAIRYANDVGYSRYQNASVLLFDRIGRHALQAYGSNSQYFVKSDLDAVFKDFGELLLAWKIVDATTPTFGEKRLRDMDLFTPASNGNNQASIPEFVNYALMITSSSILTNQMRSVITATCDSGLGEDNMGWTLLPAPCFRSQFNERLDYWIKQDFPRMYSYWQTLSPSEKRTAARWLEHGSRRNGYTDEDFGQYDIGAVGVILYYVETLFTRFDTNNDEQVSKSEVNAAYPLFKNLIRKSVADKAIDTGSDFILKGVFTYIVKYQSLPLTPVNGANIAKFAAWVARYYLPTAKYDTDRYGVFNIVCQISEPENPNVGLPTEVACAP